MLKYLRIAVTALSLTVCGHLIVLWGWSFFAQHRFEARAYGKGVLVISRQGNLDVNSYAEVIIGPRQTAWHWQGDFDLPYSLLVLGTATLATVPWIRSRFSLRTLLIAMTLVAVVLGVIVAAL